MLYSLKRIIYSILEYHIWTWKWHHDVSEHNLVSLSRTSACLCFTKLLFIKSANLAREKNQGLSRDKYRGIGVNM